jgi:tellurite resistance protein
MSEAMTIVAQGKPQLEYLPVGLFGSVMGLTGLSVAWKLAHEHFGVPAAVGTSIAWVAVVDFLALLVAYGVKAATAWSTVKAEFRHPVAGTLFGTILVSLLLLPIIVGPVSTTAARVLWVIGAAGMALFAFLIVTRWVSEKQQYAHAMPVWIIPAVGLLDLPLAAPWLGFQQIHGLLVFALAVGLFFVIPLFTLIFSRLLFEAEMPAALRPSLLILVAPFAVGYSSYVTVTGHPDLFASALFMVMLFLLAVLVGQMRYLRKCCPFRVSWWAVSFPLAASATAAMRYASADSSWILDGIAILILALASATIVGLLIRTLVGLARGELRTLSTP